MAVLEYKISARLSISSKEKNGILCLTNKGLIFEGSSGKTITRLWDWADSKWVVGIERTSVFLFIKKEVPYFIISNNSSDDIKIYLNNEDVNRLEKALKSLQKDAYNKRLEDIRRKEEIRRQEELDFEIKRKKQEEQRLEAEMLQKQELIRRFVSVLETHSQFEKSRNKHEIKKLCYVLETYRRNSLKKVVHLLELLYLETERKSREKELSFEAERARCEEKTCHQEQAYLEAECRQVEKDNSEEIDTNWNKFSFKNCNIYLALQTYFIQNSVSDLSDIFAQHILDFFEVFLKASEYEVSIEACMDSLDEFNSVCYQFNINHSMIEIVNSEISTLIETENFKILYVEKLLRRLFDALHFYERSNYLSYDESEEDYYLEDLKWNFRYSNYNGDYSCKEEIDELLRDVRRFQSSLEEEYREERIYKTSEEVANYIYSQPRPVSKDNLKQKFDTLSGKTMEVVLSKNDILVLGNRYFSVRNVVFDQAEVNMLCNTVSAHVSENGGFCHVDVIYEEVQYKYRDLLYKCFISDAKGLFSLLKYFMDREFQFSEMFITNKSFGYVSGENILREYVFGKSEIAVADLDNFAKRNHIKVASTLKFMMSLNDKMLLRNRECLMSIDKLMVSNKISQMIETEIQDELRSSSETKAIRDLKCVSKFPSISVPWDEWLVYSVLNKWGLKLSIFTTSPRFSSAIPVVSLHSLVSADELEQIAKRFEGMINQVMTNKIDSLDNLDELIEDDISLEDLADFADLDFGSYGLDDND